MTRSRFIIGLIQILILHLSKYFSKLCLIFGLKCVFFLGGFFCQFFLGFFAYVLDHICDVIYLIAFLTHLITFNHNQKNKWNKWKHFKDKKSILNLDFSIRWTKILASNKNQETWSSHVEGSTEGRLLFISLPLGPSH